MVVKKKKTKAKPSQIRKTKPVKAHSIIKKKSVAVRSQPKSQFLSSAAENETRQAGSISHSVKSNFVASKWTIRNKLMVIISGLIMLSLTLMIFLASYFFKSDNEVRIKENNIKLTDVIGQKITSDINSLSNTLNVIATTLEQSPGSEVFLSRTVFKNDKNLISLGIYSVTEGGLSPVKTLQNYAFMQESDMSEATINAATRANVSFFRKSFSGATVIHNVSQGFKIPVIAISFPYVSSSGAKLILLAYSKIDRFLSIFQASGITETFMVSTDGRVLAHADTKLLMQGARFSDLPIVKAMISSAVDSGLTRYKNKNGEWFIGSYRKLGVGGIGVISTVPEDKAFEEVYNIQRRNFYLMIVVINLAVLIVFYFAKGLTQPILKLVGASRQIELGQYNLNITPTTTDEIGVLTNSFVSMAGGLLERESLKSAFGKFVNKEIAELAMKGDLKLGGERKDCVIMFTDIRNFTSISERLEPEEVVEFLNKYLEEMVHCVNEYHGTVDKFIGDAIMAVWGALRQTTNDTEQAIDCALAMRDSLIKFNRGRGSAKKPIIKIGIGINTGNVISGQIGSQQKLDFTVIGDAVNLASRVEALNKPFGTDILITQNSYERVKNLFKVEKMESIKVKGKSEPQVIYAVLGRSKDNKSLSSVKELRKFVGIDTPPPYNRKVLEKVDKV